MSGLFFLKLGGRGLLRLLMIGNQKVTEIWGEYENPYLGPLSRILAKTQFGGEGGIIAFVYNVTIFLSVLPIAKPNSIYNETK